MKVEQNSEHPTLVYQGDGFYLRAAKQTDFDAIKAYRQDEENCRYIRPPEDDETTQMFVDKMANPWKLEEGNWNGTVLCLQGDDTVVGEIAFNIEDWEHQRAEIGYRLNASVAGKGLCTKAMRILVDYLFETIGVEKIVAKCDPRNIASSRVMEKLGMKREAQFKHHFLIGDEWTDQDDYGLIASEWRENKS